MSNRNNKYFVALTGAKKNVGDFLITNRALALLNKIAPDYDIVVRPHWKLLEDLDFINNSEGVIILGGPGFQMNMYPGVYKMVDNLEAIKVPIHTLGAGWKGVPGDRTTEKLYRFTDSAREMLNIMEDSTAGMSCRDYQTQRALNNNGYKNVSMTGCPVWYDLDSIGKDFVAPKEIKKIIYTPAQDEVYSEQSIEVLKYLKGKYPKAEIITSFHRGIGEVDEFTPESDAKNTAKLAEASRELGAEVVDVSFDANKLNFYDDCDLHVGYRVHAHIYFLSKRLPSILLHEDGRGNGVSDALNSPGIDAYRTSKALSGFFGMFNKQPRLLSLYRKQALKVNPDITKDLDRMIDDLESQDFSWFENTSQFIDDHYKVMEKFILNMTSKSEV